MGESLLFDDKNNGLYNQGMEELELIRQAVNQALKTMKEGVGGPFGAAIINPEGKVYVA